MCRNKTDSVKPSNYKNDSTDRLLTLLAEEHGRNRDSEEDSGSGRSRSWSRSTLSREISLSESDDDDYERRDEGEVVEKKCENRIASSIVHNRTGDKNEEKKEDLASIGGDKESVASPNRMSVASSSKPSLQTQHSTAKESGDDVAHNINVLDNKNETAVNIEAPENIELTALRNEFEHDEQVSNISLDEVSCKSDVSEITLDGITESKVERKPVMQNSETRLDEQCLPDDVLMDGECSTKVVDDGKTLDEMKDAAGSSELASENKSTNLEAERPNQSSVDGNITGAPSKPPISAVAESPQLPTAVILFENTPIKEKQKKHSETGTMDPKEAYGIRRKSREGISGKRSMHNDADDMQVKGAVQEWWMKKEDIEGKKLHSIEVDRRKVEETRYSRTEENEMKRIERNDRKGIMKDIENSEKGAKRHRRMHESVEKDERVSLNVLSHGQMDTERMGPEEKSSKENNRGSSDRHSGVELRRRADKYGMNGRYKRGNEIYLDTMRSREDRATFSGRYKKEDIYVMDGLHPREATHCTGGRLIADDRYHVGRMHTREDRYNLDGRHSREDKYYFNGRLSREERFNDNDRSDRERKYATDSMYRTARSHSRSSKPDRRSRRSPMHKQEDELLDRDRRSTKETVVTRAVDGTIPLEANSEGDTFLRKNPLDRHDGYAQMRKAYSSIQVDKEAVGIKRTPHVDRKLMDDYSTVDEFPTNNGADTASSGRSKRYVVKQIKENSFEVPMATANNMHTMDEVSNASVKYSQTFQEHPIDADESPQKQYNSLHVRDSSQTGASEDGNTTTISKTVSLGREHTVHTKGSVPAYTVLENAVKQADSYNKILEKEQMWKQNSDYLRREGHSSGRKKNSSWYDKMNKLVTKMEAERKHFAADTIDESTRLVEARKEERKKALQNKEREKIHQYLHGTSDVWKPDKYYTEVKKTGIPWVNPINVIARANLEEAKTPRVSSSSSSSPVKNSRGDASSTRNSKGKHKKFRH